MADSPRRRLADRVSSSPTFIGSGSRFTGDLECNSDLVVGGEVVGDGEVRGALTLSDGGHWEGEIRAGNAVIAGNVEGSVTVAEKLELRATARIKGSLKARTIAVAKGAIIEGDMAVTSGKEVVHFEEKRGSEPKAK
ncbi:bactofilin family protein [Steroidobacter sp.]|uniref:bactofilin family protein n=1 Tax=Steroidobacter sp. TaxID=1978227 RepID=UPI001A4724EE|nr:polymer-forming cytoskeletal protein [Steroidobacter sp.]MBL8268583.1 polymer-forming cytoskeletal protein [Steroidobacter sp.]